MPLFFWFDLFLEARAEILKKNSLVFWKKFWHQKDILKLTDLYQSLKVEGPLNFKELLVIGTHYFKFPTQAL